MRKVSYDTAGNVIKRHQELTQESWNFRYDGFDRQRLAQAPTNDDELYYYDENGQRFLTVERDSNGNVTRSKHWFGGSEYWFDENAIVEKAMSNLTLSGQPFARIDNDAGQLAVQYSFHNGLGHLMASTDGGGTC